MRDTRQEVGSSTPAIINSNIHKADNLDAYTKMYLIQKDRLHACDTKVAHIIAFQNYRHIQTGAFQNVAGWWGHQPGQSAVGGVPTAHFQKVKS